MGSLSAIVLLPWVVSMLGYWGLDLGWLVWLVVLPGLIGVAQRRGAGATLLVGLLCVAPVLAVHPVDGMRVLAQIVVPGVAAGLVARHTDLRVRDGWWLALLAAGSSVLVGLAFGRGGALREVLLPAGIPTGWVEVVVSRWEAFFAALTLEAYSFARVERFADFVEPLLWFGVLVPLMGAAVALVRPTAEQRASARAADLDAPASGLRSLEADFALTILVVGLALALFANGIAAAIGAWSGVMAALFFILEGIDVVQTLLRRRRVPAVLQLLGWALIATQPLTILLLQVVGLGELRWGFRTRPGYERKG